MQSTLLEILGTRHYCLLPTAFSGMRSNVFAFLQSRVTATVETENRQYAVARFADGKLATPANRLTEFKTSTEIDYSTEEGAGEGPEVESKYINILRLTGPMTRGGGECSYGSLEHRDMLMRAADTKGVIGHIIYCRTPGGAATSLIDYRKAIDYIHSKGQKVYMFCDGMVASGGAFLSAMCDGVYAYNGEDEIGSIGMYTAFFTLANGAKNAITQETYVEYYADKSTEKNKEFRDAAEGNMEEVMKETNEYLDELLAAMKRDRPSIKVEQMNGAMFKMKDVVGSIIDGICSLPELCDLIYAEWQASAIDKQRGANTTGNTNPNHIQTMSKEYKSLAKAAGYEAEATMVSDNEGLLTLQPTEADAMEAHLEALDAQVATLSEENASLKENEVTLQASLDSATADLEAARKEVEELKAAADDTLTTQLATVRAEMQATIDTLTADKEAIEAARAALETEKAQLAEAKTALEAQLQVAAQELTEKEQIISDLNEKVAQANSGAGEAVPAGESPAGNGAAAPVTSMTAAPAWDPAKSPSENAEAMKKYLAEQAAKANRN